MQALSVDSLTGHLGIASLLSKNSRLSIEGSNYIVDSTMRPATGRACPCSVAGRQPPELSSRRAMPL